MAEVPNPSLPQPSCAMSEDVKVLVVKCMTEIRRVVEVETDRLELFINKASQVTPMLPRGTPGQLLSSLEMESAFAPPGTGADVDTGELAPAGGVQPDAAGTQSKDSLGTRAVAGNMPAGSPHRPDLPALAEDTALILEPVRRERRNSTSSLLERARREATACKGERRRSLSDLQIAQSQQTASQSPSQTPVALSFGRRMSDGMHALLGRAAGEGEPKLAIAAHTQHAVFNPTSTASHLLVDDEMRAKESAANVDTQQIESLRQKKERTTIEKTRLQKLVWTTWFELVFATLIFLNSMLIGVEVQVMSRRIGQATPTPFYMLQHTCGLLFFVEIWLRICANGLRGFFFRNHRHNDSMWAWFDLLTVLCWLLEAGNDIAHFTRTVHSDDRVNNVSQLRIVRIIRISRLLRAFRIPRIIRFVAALRTLVFSILVTLKSLVWAMLLLSMIMYVFAITFTQAASDARMLEDGSPSDLHNLASYWGSLDRSLHTLFQSITGGVSWRAVVGPLEEVSMLWSWLFTCFIAFVHFAVLNVVTGIFCSSAVEHTQRNPELVARTVLATRDTYANNLKALFMHLDQDGSGLITLSELERMIGDKMLRSYFAALEIDTADAWTLFKLIDSDRTGAIDIDEFVMGCEQLKGSARSIDLASMSYEIKSLAKLLVRLMCHLDAQVGAGGKATQSHTSEALFRARQLSASGSFIGAGGAVAIERHLRRSKTAEASLPRSASRISAPGPLPRSQSMLPGHVDPSGSQPIGPGLLSPRIVEALNKVRSPRHSSPRASPRGSLESKTSKATGSSGSKEVKPLHLGALPVIKSSDFLSQTPTDVGAQGVAVTMTATA